MKVRDLLIFIAGVGVGIGASYNIIKKKHDEILEEEIASVKETYSKKNEEEKKCENPDKETPEPEETVKEKYEKLAKEYSSVKEDDKLNKVNTEIYEISYDDFGEEGYEEIELTYYINDRVLTDECGDEMEEVDIVSSVGSLDILDNRKDCELVYIRNTEKEVDYEITISTDRYDD